MGFDRLSGLGKAEHGIIVGAGLTGRALARFLTAKGCRVSVLDEGFVADEVKQEIADLSCSMQEQVEPESLSAFEPGSGAFAVLSPGVSSSSRLVSWLAERGIPMFSEIDLAVAELGTPEIAVTGTNGKTTTVSLLEQIFRADGRRAQALGNVGRPLISFAQAAAERLLPKEMILEVSSYQLEQSRPLKPKIGIWLNLTADHLERHQSMKQYLAAKALLFSRQDASDWSILYADDPLYHEMKDLACGRVLPFGCSDAHGFGCFYSQKREELTFSAGGEIEKYDMRSFIPLGVHNRLNMAAALAAARLSAVSKESIEQVIAEFRPLPHRLEVIRTAERLYINDSKATNPSSVLASLQSIDDEFISAQVILLIGGRAKDAKWEDLGASIRQKRIKRVIGFGGDGESILSKLESLEVDADSMEYAGGFKKAVERAKELSTAADVVLLSPGCASFDEFASFEARGDCFRQLVSGEQ